MEGTRAHATDATPFSIWHQSPSTLSLPSFSPQECPKDAGAVFQPMIFESTGGVSAEAERVIKCLNKAVAENSDSSVEVVATRFWQRVGVDLLRGSCRAFHRRVGRGGTGSMWVGSGTGLIIPEGM